jgi:glyoxylase-like metal-dependent hydrolase (beta-lactamase superfamily II)
MTFKKITENVFAVGGSNFSNSEDALSYLVKTKKETLVLVDCGLDSIETIIKNIEDTGNDPEQLEALILTHLHIDHIGSAYNFTQKFPNLKIYAHEWDKSAIEGDENSQKKTVATWYGKKYKPVKVDVVLTKIEEKHDIGGTKFLMIHTPGHTPGSISIIIEDDNKKILFGQDIHGPFMKEFDSNIRDWANSMKLLLSKKCDILCEGHFGIYETNLKLEKFIRGQLKQQKMD